MPDAAEGFSRTKLPKAVWRLGWVSLFTDVATEMSYPLLPAFLATMGAAGQWLGWVEGIAESVGAFVKYFAGAASDRAASQSGAGTGRKRYVVFGYTLSSLVRPLLSLAVAPWQVVALRASDRVGKGIRSAPRDALLAAAISPEARAYAFGFHQMMDNIGAVIGPLVAFTLARAAGMSLRAIFAFAIVPGLIAVATLAFGVHEASGSAEGGTSQTPGATGSAEGGTSQTPGASTPSAPSLSPHVKRYLVAVAVFSLGASADTFLLLRLSRQHLPDAYLPIAWLSLNAMKALTNIPGGRLSDRIGHKWTLLGGWTLYAAAYATFPFAHTITATWLVLLAYGFYYGLTEGAEKALLTELTPKEQRGRAFGTLHAITGFAVLPANAVFGYLFDTHPEAAFLMGASCAALGALLLLILVRPTKS
jgi:MFS family permease